MKKVLALVLSFALVFSTFGMAFADTTTTTPAAPALSADATICSDLGMLKGATGTVDAAYTATTPTKIQSAIMVLRLKGLEAEALAFTGTENFADADKAAWAKPVMAYLKAHPELGFVGSNNNFDPTANITAQQYYKVMLESLGYKQNTAEVVGDFAWNDVIAFAATKSLSKAAAATNFTIDNLATATVETLKGAVKGGTTTLASTLVAAGKLDAAKATTAGVYTAAAATTVALKAVKAIGNTKVEVEYTAAVDKAYAETVANYSVVVKDSTTALEVKAAVLDGTKKVVLETAAQTTGKAYTLKVGEVSLNFGGVAKKSDAPELDKAEGTDTETVEVTFTEIMDLASALDVNSYKVTGVTVEKAEWADSSRKIVTLTTKGMAAGRNYTVSVANVKSVDLVNLKSASKNFLAKTDKTAPKIASVEKDTNTRIQLHFDEEVDTASAEALANYKITVGSATSATTLDIVSAKLVEDGDNDDEMRIVELTTASQKSGQKYVLHVVNVTDVKVLANKMVKEDTEEFYGKAVDDSKPVPTVDILTSKMIRVTFADADGARLDPATALDINNYTVNNDITVEKAAFADASDPDCMEVRLTVSEMGDKTSYTTTVKNVADEYGNICKDKSVVKSYNKANFAKVATVEKVVYVSKTSVAVYFTQEVTVATANNPANYSINKEIGTPIKAKLTTDAGATAYKKVTLTTEELAANTEYKVTVTGVEDIAGNVISGVASKFIAAATDNDVDAPEVDEVEAVNADVVRVTFDEAIDLAVDPVIYIDWAGADTNGAGTPGDVTATYKVSTDADDKVLEFNMGANPFTTDADVKLVGTTAKDAAGNICEVSATDSVEFSSNKDAADDVELLSWEQISVKKFKLQFSEKIKIPAAGAGRTITDTATTIVPYTLTISQNDFDDDDLTVVYLTSSSRMPEDKNFELTLAGSLTNFHGKPVLDPDKTSVAPYTAKVTALETGLVDEDVPYIVSVTANNRQEILVKYNEDLSNPGTYAIKYVDKDGKDQDITISSVSLDDVAPTEVTLALSELLESRYVYTLEIGTTRAADIALNKVDEDAEFDFAGTDVVTIGNYITGVKVINGTKLEVRTNSACASIAAGNAIAAAATVTYGSPATTVTTVNAAVFSGTATTTKVYTIDITPANSAWVVDRTYTVTLDGMEFDFVGAVEADVTAEVVGSDYVFSYDEVQNGDVVRMTSTAGATAGTVVNATAAGTPSVAKASVAGWTEANVLVLRNNVPLYYAEAVALTTLPAAPLAAAVTVAAPAVGVAVGKTTINIAATLEFRITDVAGVEKQAWTTGTGAALTTTATVVATDIIQVRVKAAGAVPSGVIYTQAVVAGDIGA